MWLSAPPATMGSKTEGHEILKYFGGRWDRNRTCTLRFCSVLPPCPQMSIVVFQALYFGPISANPSIVVHSRAPGLVSALVSMGRTRPRSKSDRTQTQTDMDRHWPTRRTQASRTGGVVVLGVHAAFTMLRSGCALQRQPRGHMLRCSAVPCTPVTPLCSTPLP
jgi:hypothetical protein